MSFLISPFALKVLIYGALALAGLALVTLLVLLIIDWARKSIW